MKAVVNECIRSHIEAFATDKEKSSLFQTVFGHIESGLKYQCHAAWSQVNFYSDVMHYTFITHSNKIESEHFCKSANCRSLFQVLHLLSVVFEVAGPYFHAMMGTCLRSLADLRSATNFSLINELVNLE